MNVKILIKYIIVSICVAVAIDSQDHSQKYLRTLCLECTHGNLKGYSAQALHPSHFICTRIGHPTPLSEHAKWRGGPKLEGQGG